jgi:Prealbumin-like fold domain
MSLGSLRHRPVRRRWVFGLTTTAVAAVMVLFVASASGILTGSPSNFESNDGNMIAGAGNHDWNNVSFTHVVDIASSQADDSFVSGQKQDTVCPDTYQHGNPPKDDFTDVASYSETNTTTGDTYLYGATIRYTANGSASENIELKQGTSGFCPGSTTLLARTPGDKLIAVDYTQGGTQVAFNVLTWVASGACFVSNDTAPCWGATVLSLSGAGAEGLASQAPITAANNPISGTALVTGQFAEFGINLATAGIIPRGTCKAFPQTIWESRSSGSSFVSTTKDISIENKTISNCGEIIIKKRSNPRGLDQNFSFTSTIPNPPAPVTSNSSPYCQADTSPSAFTLNDKDGATGDSSNNTEDCLNVAPGNYTVTEGADPSGFVFGTLSCTATGTGSSGAQDGTVVKQANITIASGGVVTCVYTNNQQLGAIKITKRTTKSGNAGLQGATFTITKGGTGITGSPFTSGADGTICVDNLGFGDYVVTETKAPDGYNLDDSTGQTVTVDNNAKCSDDPYVGESITFDDTPLTDLQVKVTSEASGGTKSAVSCVDSSNADIGNSPQPTGVDLLDTSTYGDPVTLNADPTHGGALKPGTYTCTVIIDP